MKSSKSCAIVIAMLSVFFSISIIQPGVLQSQSNVNGVSYLKSSQNANGSWGGTATSLNGIFPTTAAALAVLRVVETTTSANQTNAIQFLTSQTVEENPFLAARVIALAGTSSSTTADVNTLLGRQNTDGGWGTAEGFESNPLDTSFALLALKAANVSNNTVFTNALNYLIGRQNTDGGWALTTGEDSQIYYSAIALQALNSCRLQFAFLTSQTRALNYLRGKQNAGGGYGSPSSTPFETAVSLLAIFGAGQPLTTAETTAINFLNNGQQTNGSWAGDPYSTALALSALAFPRDSDADGMTDSYETAEGLNPNDASDASGDKDGDGLTNVEEFRLGTKASNSDSDGDGVNDQTEVFSGSNPLDPASKNRSPQITSEPKTTASEQKLYTYQAQATDPDLDTPLAFSLVQAPNGMSITTSGLIQWTPSSSQIGSSAVILKVSDGKGGSALQQYQLMVLAQGIDLSVDTVDAGAVTTDTQSLVIGGTARVDIRNKGGSTLNGSFEVLLFEDRNANGTYQSGPDIVLGTETFSGSILSNAVALVNVRVSGIVSFRDNLIHAQVDSASQVAELDETNNLGNSGQASKYLPPAGIFQPKVKWEFYSPLNNGGVSEAPLVAPLIDTNGDSVVNERDVPAVIFSLGSTGQGSDPRFMAVRGDTQAVIFDVPFAYNEFGGANSAVGDLDGDGVPEILITEYSRAVVHCFNNDGTRRWTSPVVRYRSSPTIADLDGDGRAEILYGTIVFNFDGTIRWDSGFPGYVGGAGQSAAARQDVDLDLDDKPEIIAGPSALDPDGKYIWYWETLCCPFYVRGKLDRGATTVIQNNPDFPLLTDSFTAVANLDDDPNPEVIVVNDQSAGGSGKFADTLWVFEHDGRIKPGFPIGLYLEVFNQESYRLGPPTIADFDGDGQPDIAIPAGKIVHPAGVNGTNISGYIMAVYERNGTLKWRRELIRSHALFNGVEPLVAFDFDGNGSMEIGYRDEQKFYILNGSNGATLFELGVAGVPLAVAYPTVADLDNDGLAEIIVPTGPFPGGSPSRRGFVVLGDTKGNWRNARRIWNQWLYHVTNVNENGGIPKVQKNNWQTLNNSRTQVPIDGLDRTAAPDLTVSKVTINAQSCPASVGITARIGNGGSLHVAAGQTVHFYNGDPTAGGARIGSKNTTRALYPGEFEDVTLMGVSPPSTQIWARVNEEPVETLTPSNNLVSLPHTWAQASGYCISCTALSNMFANRGIDGMNNTRWIENPFRPGDVVPSGSPFYEVRFQFPVNATSVTIQNNTSGFSPSNSGFLTGTLSFSNGFSTPFTFNANGEGTITFAEQQNVSWVRLTATTTRADGASLSEFIVTGSYTEPQFRIIEGTGRTGNNKAASGFIGSPCDTTANQPPLITSAPVITGKTGVAYSYLAQATDANNDGLTFSLATAPSGMTISTTSATSALLTWTPADSQTGNAAVTVSVSDGRGGLAQQSFTISVTAPPGVNRPPQFTSVPMTSVTVGQSYPYDVNATDPDGDIVIFSLLQSPAGAAIDLSSGLISWTPGTAQIGSRFFTVEAQDGRGGRPTQSFAVDVRPISTALPPLPKDQDGDGFDETVDCNDNNANVNPGKTEIPGNGLDDDCNPATPDTLPANSISCSLVTDKRSYNSNSLAQLSLTVQNLSSNLSIVGLQAQITVADPAGQSVFSTTVPVSTLPPNDLFAATAVFSTQARPPGTYQAAMEVRFGSAVSCQSQVSFAVLSSATQGNALTGSISASPARIEKESTFSYEVRNQGNVNLSSLNLKILVVHIKDGTVARTLTDQASLSKGQVFSNTKTFSALGVKAGDYLAILQGESGGMTQTVDAAPISIVGQPKLGGTATPGVDASGFYVDVRFTNSGSFYVRNIVISQLILRTLSGTGTVTYNTAVSPPLPRVVGDLDVGASITVRLYLNRPSTVTRFSITEAGSMQSEAGTNYNYSMAQSVIP